MRTITGIGLALVLVSSPVALAQSSLLDLAKAKIERLDYANAYQLLDQAAEEPSVPRADLIQILELKGVASAALGQMGDAQTAFRELVMLEPTFKLPRRWGPRIQTAFFSAKAWLDDQQPMSLSLAQPEVVDRKVTAIAVHLGSDPMGVVRGIRAHLMNPGAPETLETRETHAPATVTVSIRPTAAARFWVEAIGAHGEVLQELGSKDSPLVEVAEETNVTSTPPLIDASVPAAPGAAPVTREPIVPRTRSAATTSRAPPSLLPLAFTLGGVGLASLITGVIFGVMMANINQQLTTASFNSQHSIVGLTQANAEALSAQANTDALVANVTLIGGSLLLATGIGVMIYGAVQAGGAHPTGTVGVTAVW